MTKSIFSLLLVCLISFAGFAQQLDSVQINNEWRYVYPVNERIDFEDEYYSKFQLTAEEFPIWIQWKMASDPRADLKWKELKQALQSERYKRKDITDSVYNKKNDDSYTTGGFHRLYSEKEAEEHLRLLYMLDCKRLDFIPPVVRNLPNGKYVQFFEPFATYDKHSKAVIITRRIAAEFELSDNELQNKFERFEPDSTLVSSGNFDKNLKTGLWLETIDASDAYRKNGKLHFYNKISRSNYELGIKDGESRIYWNDFLSKIEHYEKGELVGEKTQIDYQDSVVYDLYSTVDVLVNSPGLEKIHGRGVRSYPPDFKEKVKLPKYYEINRIQPYLFDSYSLKQLDIRTYPDSVLGDPNSQYKTFRLRSGTVPIFETYYKIYDRKTGNLIFECYLDTVTKLYSGASWYPNGQKFDTIWTNPETMDLERIIYDLNGAVLYNSLDGEENDAKIIDGFVAYPSYNKKKEINYYFSHEAPRGDTLFERITWDVDGKLTSNEYRIAKDSVFYSIAHYGNDFCLFESNPERELITYTENGFEFHAMVPKKGGDPVIDIRLNGQSFEGPVEFSTHKKDRMELKNGKLELLYKGRASALEIELGNVSKDQSTSRSSCIRFMQAILLNFEESGMYVESVTSTLKNNRLEGKTILEDYKSKEIELDYKNGLPNGKVLVYRKRNNYTVDFTQHNEADPACHFSEKGKRKVYLAKSYTFKNGVLDGPMVSYAASGDTIGVIPFSNGLKHGKVVQYRESTRTNAEFRNDTLTDKIQVFTIDRNSVYDTLCYVALDNNGNMTSALYKRRIYKRELLSYMDKRMHYKKLPNGRVECEISENNDVFERDEIDSNKYIKFDLIQANMVKFTEEFTTEAKPDCYDEIIKITSGLDNDEIGIVWNKESVKHHQYHNSETGNFRYRSEREKFPRYIKKFFSNGVILREGSYACIADYKDQKSGIWKVNDYNGKKLYELNYVDSVITVDSLSWSIIGFMTEFDSLGNTISTKAVLSEKETYECSSDDYYAERQYITLSSQNPTKINGWMKNYYDNGALMNEGKVVNGIPEGLWKFYTPDGKLTRLGNYLKGRENGKWLFGDLGDKAYIGEVCIDPNDPEYEFVLHQLEVDKEIEVVVYKNGAEINSSSFSSARHKRLEYFGDSF